MSNWLKRAFDRVTGRTPAEEAHRATATGGKAPGKKNQQPLSGLWHQQPQKHNR